MSIGCISRMLKGTSASLSTSLSIDLHVYYVLRPRWLLPTMFQNTGGGAIAHSLVWPAAKAHTDLFECALFPETLVDIIIIIIRFNDSRCHAKLTFGLQY